MISVIQKFQTVLSLGPVWKFKFLFRWVCTAVLESLSWDSRNTLEYQFPLNPWVKTAVILCLFTTVYSSIQNCSSQLPNLIMAQRGSERQIAEGFFTRDSRRSWYWQWGIKRRIKRRKTRISYQNLTSHVRTAHPDYEMLLKVDFTLLLEQLHRFSRQESRAPVWMARAYHQWLTTVPYNP